MARPIDAEQLYRKIKTECNPYGNPSIEWEDGKKVMEWIEHAPTINDWISVKDELPQNHETVIVAIDDDSGDSHFRYTGHGWYFNEAKSWIVDDERRTDVYAWKRFPEPPEVN